MIENKIHFLADKGFGGSPEDGATCDAVVDSESSETVELADGVMPASFGSVACEGPNRCALLRKRKSGSAKIVEGACTVTGESSESQ